MPQLRPSDTRAQIANASPTMQSAAPRGRDVERELAERPQVQRVAVADREKDRDPRTAAERRAPGVASLRPLFRNVSARITQATKKATQQRPTIAM
jgi:hypothetical protein